MIRILRRYRRFGCNDSDPIGYAPERQTEALKRARRNLYAPNVQFMNAFAEPIVHGMNDESRRLFKF
jgi:hypothetical protein